MANEITRSAYTITYKKGTGSFTHPVPELKLNVSGDEYEPGYMQAIGVVQEAIQMNEITAGGVWSFRNMAAAGGGTISIRAATGAVDLMDILPGEEWTIRLSAAATAPFAVATVAANLLITRVDL